MPDAVLLFPTTWPSSLIARGFVVPALPSDPSGTVV